MKGWCKIIELSEFDVLVQRLVNKSDGEHVQITVRFPDGQYLTQAKFGDGPGAEKLSTELYESYGVEDAKKLIQVFKKAIDEKTNSEDNNIED